MNEKIKELAKQAGFGVYGDERIGTPQFGDYIKDGAMEKFAELIIMECCRAVRHDDSMFGGKFQKIIVRHFGVE